MQSSTSGPIHTTGRRNATTVSTSPPTQREPYGRREDSCPLVVDVPSMPAEWVPGCHERRYVPMPRGGARCLIACPWCKRWVIRLYYLPGLPDMPLCRHCAGLKYPSQYQGRRPEASKERLADLFGSVLTARTPAARERRGKRWEQAVDAYTAKELHFVQAIGADIEHMWRRLHHHRDLRTKVPQQP